MQIGERGKLGGKGNIFRWYFLRTFLSLEGGQSCQGVPSGDAFQAARAG